MPYALAPIWRIKDRHDRMMYRTFPNRVQTSPVKIPPLPLAVHCAVDLPQTIWLIGIHTGPSDRRIQQPTGKEHIVADHLSAHPHRWPSCQKHFVGIYFFQILSGQSFLTVGGGHDHHFLQGFNVPTGLSKPCRQPIQQLRMGRHFPLVAEVTRSSYQPPAKQVLPKSVDRKSTRLNSS